MLIEVDINRVDGVLVRITGCRVVRVTLVKRRCACSGGGVVGGK